jgi:hypothetical protein
MQHLYTFNLKKSLWCCGPLLKMFFIVLCCWFQVSWCVKLRLYDSLQEVLPSCKGEFCKQNTDVQPALELELDPGDCLDVVGGSGANMRSVSLSVDPTFPDWFYPSFWSDLGCFGLSSVEIQTKGCRKRRICSLEGDETSFFLKKKSDLPFS